MLPAGGRGLRDAGLVRTNYPGVAVAFPPGAIKAIGAVAVAAYVVSGQGLETWRSLADVVLLVLTTNLGNLLDLRPGRAEKELALLGAGLCLFAWTLAPIELLR